MTGPTVFPLFERVRESSVSAVGRDMLLGGGEGLRTFYKNFCRGGEQEGEASASGALTFSSLRCVIPEEAALPSLLRSISPCAGKGFIGCDQVSRAAHHLDVSGAVRPLPAPGGRPLASTLHAGGRTYMLAQDGSTLWIAEGDLSAVESIGLPEGIGPNATLVQAGADGATILSPAAKALFRLGPLWTLADRRRLCCHHRLQTGAPFRDGHVFLEWLGDGYCGANLLYFPPQGPPRHVAGGFRSPGHVSAFEHGLLVCDFSGLHILVMDGLNVLRSACMPWTPLLRWLGRDRGIGYEATLVDGSLYVACKFTVPLVGSSQSYCVVHGVVEGISVIHGE